MATSVVAALSLLVAIASPTLAAPTKAYDLTAFPPRVTPNFLDHEGAYLKLDKRQEVDPSVVMPKLNAKGCLPPGTTAKQMNLILARDSERAKVILCPNTNYPIANTLIFQSNYQEIMTLGYPTGTSRATLTVVGDGMSVAVYGACDKCVGITLRSIQINGNRPALGPVQNGAAIVEIGGNPPDQIVRDCNIYEPRGWSCLHTIEGWNNNCRNATLINNQLGPAGNSPNTAQQFKRAVAYQAPGYWADGISNACAGSTITGNTIIDATDGAIVQFGAPNTTIARNTIIQRTRVALGGINMVDMGVYGGDFTGVSIESNVFRAEGAMIKIGIPMGPFTWSPVNSTDYRTRNGRVVNNKFLSTGNGYFGYAIAAAGHMNADVRGNDASGAKFGGIPSGWCIGDVQPPRPVAPGVVYDPYTTSGSFQASAVKRTLGFLICLMQSSYGSYTWSSSAAPSSTAAASSVSKAVAAKTTSTLAKIGKIAANIRPEEPDTSTAAPVVTRIPKIRPVASEDETEVEPEAEVVVQKKRSGVNSAVMVARGLADEASLRALEARDYLAAFEEGPASPWAKRDVLETFEASDFLL